ncbi:MAG: LssY C-terminal domain-containing protein [Micrococcaceae bacterium]
MVTEKLNAKKKQFEKKWLNTVILWGQRALFLTVFLAAGWVVYYLLFPKAFTSSFFWVFVAIWLLLAYIILPRIHKILSAIYLPSYFIGRVRTPDGLLGDPVNIAATGTESDIRKAMVEAGWVEADPLDWQSTLKIIKCTVMGQPYPNAPVSTLMLFGNKQDLAFQQEVSGTTSQRHHVRFWKTPKGWLLPGGFEVEWLAAGTFDRRIGFSVYTLQVTHKIAERTDEERDYIVQSVSETGLVHDVEVIKNYSTGYHDRNGGGDTIETDGDLPVIHFTADRDLSVEGDPEVITGQDALEELTQHEGKYAFEEIEDKEAKPENELEGEAVLGKDQD